MIQLGGISPQRPCREKFVFGRRFGIPAIYHAPTPVFGALHHIRSQRMAFHIQAEGKKWYRPEQEKI